MEIRKMGKGDVVAIAKLASQVIAPQFKAVGESFLNEKQYAEALKNAIEVKEFLVIAEEGKDIAGFLHWYYQDNQAFVEDLVISPKFQKSGIGTALVNFLLTECKRDKIGSVSSLLPHGSPGIKFAEKFGFKPVSVEMKRKL